MSLPYPELAAAWRSARPPPRVVHLDHAACSRQSVQVLDAVAAHARSESEIGGYQAEAAATAVLEAGRTAIGSLVGTGADSVAFVEGARAGLFALLTRWPFAAGDTVGCARGEYGPNLSAFARHRLVPRFVPTDEAGRVDVDELPRWLDAERPVFLHLTQVPSQRGIVHPVARVGSICRDHGVPLIVDVAQSLGHVPTSFEADAVYGTSRKWLAGPRGVGFVAVRREAFDRLRVLNGDDEAGPPIRRLESSDAHVAGRVGLCLAVSDFVTAGADSVHSRLAAIGPLTREILGGVTGWRIVEASDEPTAVTTLVPPADVSVAALAAKLLAEHGILTGAVPLVRAPAELTTPVLRISGHVETTVEQIEALARALVD